MSASGTIEGARIRITRHECLLFPDIRRYEIIDGKRYAVATPDTRHQRISRNLLVGLCRYVRHRELGEVLSAPYDLVLSECNILQPDILFVRKERTGLIGKLNLRAAPDLVIEILSEASWCKDMGMKKRIYSRYHIPEYWIVDPKSETVELLLWSELGYITAGAYGIEDRLSSPLLHDFGFPLHHVFADWVT